MMKDDLLGYVNQVAIVNIDFQSVMRALRWIMSLVNQSLVGLILNHPQES
jgi:hypothetical protein